MAGCRGTNGPVQQHKWVVGEGWAASFGYSACLCWNNVLVKWQPYCLDVPQTEPFLLIGITFSTFLCCWRWFYDRLQTTVRSSAISYLNYFRSLWGVTFDPGDLLLFILLIYSKPTGSPIWDSLDSCLMKQWFCTRTFPGSLTLNTMINYYFSFSAILSWCCSMQSAKFLFLSYRHGS